MKKAENEGKLTENLKLAEVEARKYERKLVVIDGKSVFYRGYYAMGNLALFDGTPTGGVYGFAAIAMEIVKDLAPTEVVVAWDAKGSADRRKEIYPEYKAGRRKPGEDFYAQIPLLKELVAGLGWSFMECPGYEADDIIGTLARQADEDGRYMTYIVSSDLDMLQVVDENTRMYRILKGFSDLEELDVPAVEAKYGIEKAQFLDLKALKGDASDNIPGVPGIGEKTAVKLLNQYGDLEGIYRHLDEITSAGVREKLAAGKESAEMSYQLAKIMTDAPVELSDVPEFVLDKTKAAAALQKLEFNSLIRKFGLENATVEKKAAILSPDELKARMYEDEKLREQVISGEYFAGLPTGTVLYDLDYPLVPVLYAMERRGMLIDREYFKRLKTEFAEKASALEKEIWELAGEEFNVNSPLQLSEVLYGKLGLPTDGVKKTMRGYSTGAKELAKLVGAHPIIELLAEYREVSKLLSTYVTPLPELADEGGRVHTTFTQDVTATGRLSSVNPNLQNIPVRTEEGRRIRTGFVAEEGKVLVSADYSQFELRLAAVLAGDEKLIDDFNQGIDIHTKTAAEVFGVPMGEVTKMQRRAAKVVNFGVLYGMSPKGLAEATGMTMGEAGEFIRGYFALRAPIKQYLEGVLKQAKEQGYVETFYGRRRMTPDVKSPNFAVRAAAVRAAQNMPIQGTEADLMKRAMIRVAAELPEGADLVMQVHDSLIVECDAGLEDAISEILMRVMTGVAPELPIKLAVEVTSGGNWGEL